ncbi:AT-hook motif nuclear-localized protein 9-like [Dendronephthya gigantea]|uniref:AT-hook motif nuclear-localized protein 9-like n=1 Tax=Dendronephthya gigantea TaxID=151771 RepID=UPI0010699828|nr:AT-hook motif nuclear-localized protein 9-like [Dendronephthya gigantea]
MSKYSSHVVNVETGCDIVKCLQNFTTAQNLRAAFVVECTGEVSRATLRMAESWKAHEPVKEVNYQAKIESFVGTITGENGHLHASLSSQSGCIGGHVFGPLIASETVKVVVGVCEDIAFTRSHDEATGYPELVVVDINNCELTGKPQKEMKEDSTIRTYAVRLIPGEEICNGLKSFVVEKELKTPYIMTCVGSVTKAELALGKDGTEVVTMEGFYEIVSLLGSPDNLEISISDKDGHVITGHVTGELIVFTTAEIVLADTQ